jgi:1,4-dihydroxy-2-naphthoate octaprenyltransferase
MFGVWSSLGVELFGIVLVGLTIKLMDDWLDIEFDQCIGRNTLAMRLGRACLPYALVLFGLAIAMAPKLAFSLFLAAYAIGMSHELLERMPTKMPGWLESILVLGISAAYAGFVLTAWAVCIMAMIQLLDDLMDLHVDRRSGQSNLAHRLGLVEATLLMFICLLASLLISTMHTVEVLLALPLVHMLMSLLCGIGPQGRRDAD